MYLKLYETVFITRGLNRTLLCDTHSQKIDFIPNEMGDFIISIGDKKISECFKSYISPEIEILKEYIDFIISSDYGFCCTSLKEFKYFTKKSLKFETPYQITNCIIDISEISVHFIDKIFDNVISTSIPYLQVRIVENSTIKLIDSVLNKLKLLNSSSINEIFVILPYYEEICKKLKKELIFEKHLTILFYNSPNDDNNIKIFNNVNLNFSTKLLSVPFSCGLIKQDNFIIQEDFYRESLKYNSCLNKKISIDQYGEIKNCPSILKSFGNIKNTSFEEVLSEEDFTYLWSITKNEISICKSCEFRNICTDCRAYIQEPKDIYSKPLKCGYNPSTSEWEDWSMNPLSKNAIGHYGMQELTKNL